MAIDRDGREQTLVCDKCYTFGDAFDREDFQAMISHHKRISWTVRPDPAGGWEHYCPACKPSPPTAGQEFKRQS